MSPMRKPTVAILACCLVFGILLGLTGVSKKAPAAYNDASAQGLRGGSELGVAGAVDEGKSGEDNLVSLSWPEQDAASNGFWGPDEEEREQIQLARDEEAAALVWPGQKSETNNLWGGDASGEKSDPTGLVTKDEWTHFMELDLHMDGESFSFSYDMFY